MSNYFYIALSFLFGEKQERDSSSKGQGCKEPIEDDIKFSYAKPWNGGLSNFQEKRLYQEYNKKQSI